MLLLGCALFSGARDWPCVRVMHLGRACCVLGVRALRPNTCSLANAPKCSSVLRAPSRCACVLVEDGFTLLDMECARLKGARASQRREAYSLAWTSSCASELRALGWRVLTWDMCTPKNGMRLSRRCALFNACFTTLRSMLLDTCL